MNRLLSSVATIILLMVSTSIYAQTLKTHDFNDGNLYPFNACSVSDPNYTIAENGRVKAFWTPDEYDGTRSMRGAELCCDDVVVRKHGWYGITVNLGADYQTDNTAGIGQVFQFSSETFWSWVVMMDMIEGDLCMTHRGPSSGVKTETVLYPDFPKETDMNIIIGFTLSSKDEGEIQVWINGESVYHAENISLGFGTWDSNDIQTGDYTFVTFKVGMYNFNAATYPIGDTETVYYDNVSFYNGENGYDLVDPQGDRFNNQLVEASVVDADTKQVLVEVSDNVVNQDSYEGFSLKVDDVPVAIESITLLDSLHFAINLPTAISIENTISLTYEAGNVVTEAGRPLVSFQDVMVSNLLTGAAPVLKSLTTNESGTYVQMNFTKKMLLPTTTESLILISDYFGENQIGISNVAYEYNDSTTLNLRVTERLYNDYNLSLSYDDVTIASADSGLLKPFSNLSVINMSRGLSLDLETASVDSSGQFVEFKFNRKIVENLDYSSLFSFTINGETILSKLTEVEDSTIRVFPVELIYPTDVITASYAASTSASVAATNTSVLGDFSDQSVENGSELPIKTVTKFIEAEYYNGISGTDIGTETCSDEGAGENVGSIKDGNWLMYSGINLDDVVGVDMRLASKNSGGTIEVRLGSATGTLVGTVEVPNTGGWQTWETVTADLESAEGTHDVYIVFKTSGSWVCNINWLQLFTNTVVGLNSIQLENISVYPNPVTDAFTITNAIDTRVEMLDLNGRLISSHIINDNSQSIDTKGLHAGIYLLKITSTDGATQSLKLIKQ